MPLSASAASLALVNNTHPSANYSNSANFEVGDSDTITISAATPNAPVYVSENGGPQFDIGTTNGSGAWTATGTESTAGSYSEVWYVGGTAIGALNFFVISAPTVGLTNVTNPQLAPNFYAGDSFTLTISAGSAAANQSVSVSENGGAPYNGWETNSSGNLQLAGVEGTVGSYTEQWYVAGLPATPYLSFAVTDPAATPDPAPVTYPDSVTPASPGASTSCNISGNWSDSLTSGNWNLTQNGSSASGALTLDGGSCGNVSWQVTGSVSGESASLTASNPSPPYNECDQPAATSVAVALTFSSCSIASATETATIPGSGPGYVPARGLQAASDFLYTPRADARPAVDTHSGVRPLYTNVGNGTWTLTTPVVTFSLSSPTQVPIPNSTSGGQYVAMSTGDSLQVTTTASQSNLPVNTVYISSLQTNPYSSCNATLSVSDGSGTGSAGSNMTAAVPGCSGIFALYAAVDGVTTQNTINVVVPPQVLIQVMYGEAHGQAAKYGPSDPTEQALGVTIANRFNDTVYFRGSTTYQNSITSAQFNGINTSITTGVQPELANAALVFGGIGSVSVASSKCFFSPIASAWTQIQAALASGTTSSFNAGLADPKCYDDHKQFVYKQSISTNVNGSGAPAFIFEQYRSLSAPVVVQIP